MSELAGDGQLFVPAGWCAPSSVIYDIAQELAEHPIDYNEVAGWAQTMRGGITFTVPNVDPEVVRILTGYPPEPETLL